MGVSPLPKYEKIQAVERQIGNDTRAAATALREAGFALVALTFVSLAVMYVIATAPVSGAGGSAVLAGVPSNPWLTADMYPMGLEPSRARITWNTGDGRSGQVYVSVDGAPEEIFSSGTAGIRDAPWIFTGPTYDFRLYAGTDRAAPVATGRVYRAPRSEAGAGRWLPFGLVLFGLMYAFKDPTALRKILGGIRAR
jgi:hypothetical protein